MAQFPPQVVNIPEDQHGAVAPGLQVICIPNPGTGAHSPTCPVLKLNGYSYWAYSYNDNRMDMAIIAYDPAGRVAYAWDKAGARYLFQINVNAGNQTVAFVGQGGNTINMSWQELEVPTQPGGLSVATISENALGCLFMDRCTGGIPTVTFANLTLPVGVSGTARIETRTIAGATASAGAGKTAYQYRVDMTQATSDGEVPCVTSVAVDIGPISQLKYNGSDANDAFEIAQGGAGTIGILSAIKNGNTATFIFEQPVCAGPPGGHGLSSLYFGIASNFPPKVVSMMVGWPGFLPFSVGARAPGH